MRLLFFCPKGAFSVLFHILHLTFLCLRGIIRTNVLKKDDVNGKNGSSY